MIGARVAVIDGNWNGQQGEIMDELFVVEGTEVEGEVEVMFYGYDVSIWLNIEHVEVAPA